MTGDDVKDSDGVLDGAGHRAADVGEQVERDDAIAAG